MSTASRNTMPIPGTVRAALHSLAKTANPDFMDWVPLVFIGEDREIGRRDIGPWIGVGSTTLEQMAKVAPLPSSKSRGKYSLREMATWYQRWQKSKGQWMAPQATPRARMLADFHLACERSPRLVGKIAAEFRNVVAMIEHGKVIRFTEVVDVLENMSRDLLRVAVEKGHISAFRFHGPRTTTRPEYRFWYGDVIGYSYRHRAQTA